MNRSQLFYLAISSLIFFASCKKDEGLTEEQSASFMKYYGAASTGSDMAPTPDGGFIMVGTITTGASDDVLLVKTDKYGNQQWLKTLDGPEASKDVGNAIVVTPSGGYAIVGTTISTVFDSVQNVEREFQAGRLIVTDNFGNEIASRNYAILDSVASIDIYLNGISMDNTGDNFVIAGRIQSDLLNVKIGYGLLISSTDYTQLGVIYCFTENSKGKILNIEFNDVIHSSNGSYVFVGNTDVNKLSTHKNGNIWISEYSTLNNTDTAGIGTWNVFGQGEEDGAYSIIENSTGNYVISGICTCRA